MRAWTRLSAAAIVIASGAGTVVLIWTMVRAAAFANQAIAIGAGIISSWIAVSVTAGFAAALLESVD